jgi:Sugar kinases, ribokinase family
MSALICGSFAYDTIMVFHDRFRNHILPDQVHVLNVSFMVPEMRREFGGCAGNIAYNLKLLGGDGRPMGTVGSDFGPYRQWLARCGIDHELVTEIKDTYTAQAFITTDIDDNQITAFHPGAMGYAHRNKVPQTGGITIGMVSPDGCEGMIEHANQFAEAGIPFIFDPGQGLPIFDGEQLQRFIDQANWLTLNGYESQLVQERTGLTLQQLADRVEALVVTHGGKGSQIYRGKRLIGIPIARPKAVMDPTGCGDAYRAGVLYGLMNDMDWETCGRLGALMGTIKVERPGTQNHRVEPDEIVNRFRENFGYTFE